MLACVSEQSFTMHGCLSGTPDEHRWVKQYEMGQSRKTVLLILLTTVHFFSVPTAFATYFGVTQGGLVHFTPFIISCGKC